ncbi:MAG: SDR family oxidoreductase [Chlorobi bacterium]|nr:MAG: SDR family oxidoreductase [Bacteroidota bacterium]KXK34619.1 MAG: dTDP-4-dehydrorhamnose reductase [Chlorobi bacterium OLB6]MBE2265917.1 SDR family oxidoreductase [Flavobacteriales bacterium]MBL1160922.1 SDR family oxidoreductase [Chlorobiota bacterium]MBW7852883.1 SDR family oxidoreductase [Candidatus Kapabacteria bacterium]MCC6330886.1 SDR family oxidoreductase [Ignavibacteria bacterium]
MSKTITIIGAGSTTGLALVPILLQETSATLHLVTRSKVNIEHSRIVASHVNVTSLSELKSTILGQLPSVIVNLVATSSVDACEADKETAQVLNVTLVKDLVRLARATDAHLVHLSTDYIFNGERGPYAENDTPAPINYYGKTKLSGENAVITSGISSTIIRTNVVYSPFPSRPDFVHSVLKSAETNSPVRAASDLYGNPTYVDDLAEAIVRVIETAAQGIYHVGGSDYVSRYQFATKIAEVFKLDTSLIHAVQAADLQLPAKRPLRAGLSTSTTEAVLGLRFRGIESGLICLRNSLFSK